MRKLPRDFYDRDTIVVAQELLGKCLVHVSEGIRRIGRIVEVEAYLGPHDLAAHSSKGLTPRTKVMFGPPGHAYVYIIYGMHHCMNVVCGTQGHASAVLLRAGEVVEGLDLARVRRTNIRDRDLARGPARLCSALGVNLSHNGLDLSDSPLTLELAADPAPVDRVSYGPRVGLRLAADRPWRFWLTGEPTVSVYRPATTRPRKRTR